MIGGNYSYLSCMEFLELFYKDLLENINICSH